MARILGVHGIGQQYKGEHTLRGEWLGGLKDGLARAIFALSSDEDFACAFYGHLFRSSGGKSSSIAPPLDARDVQEGLEQELLELWWHEASRLDPAVRAPNASTKAGTPRFVQRALDAMSHSRFFARVATRMLIADLKQVRCYLHDDDFRRCVQGVIEQAVGEDTRVIVAHSLGSIVAYEALCARPEWPVHTFITIGSPLGISNVVFDALKPAPEGAMGVWPAGIDRWINLADEADIVALVKELSSRFGPRVQDYLVDNGVQAHDATRYLTTRELGDAVASGL